MTLRRRQYLGEEQGYKVGFTWDTVRGKREIVGKRPDGMFLVSYPGSRSSTMSEILSAGDIDFERKRDASRLQSKAQAKAAHAKEKRAKESEEYTHGFADRFAPNARQRIINTLLKTMGFDGKIMTRKEYIEKAVSFGARVVGSGSNRRVQHSDGGFFDQKQITKTAMDYADYLVKKGFGR